MPTPVCLLAVEAAAGWGQPIYSLFSIADSPSARPWTAAVRAGPDLACVGDMHQVAICTLSRASDGS
jgi:hypothetical protein